MVKVTNVHNRGIYIGNGITLKSGESIVLQKGTANLNRLRANNLIRYDIDYKEPVEVVTEPVQAEVEASPDKQVAAKSTKTKRTAKQVEEVKE